MQSKRTNEQHRQRMDRGNTIMEFAVVMVFLIPMFTGAFTIGMTVTKGIQASNVARDALVLMVRAITDPNSGLDLSQAQNQSIIVRAAQGFGMNTPGTYNPSTTGNGVVILSKVVFVGNTECSLGIVPAPGGAPPWNAGNCPNFGQYVFAYRIVIGNTTRWTSVLGNPGVTVCTNNTAPGCGNGAGSVTPSDIASTTSDRVANFTTTIGTAGNPFTLTSSQYALISEMYADISALNFFSVLRNPIIYVRSVS
jgi:hypothetical protein